MAVADLRAGSARAAMRRVAVLPHLCARDRIGPRPERPRGG